MMEASLSQQVDKAKRKCINRVYYEQCFNTSDIRLSGMVPQEAISRYDRVCLDEGKSEFIHLYGFNVDGGRFELSISMVALFTGADEPEVHHRLGQVSFRLEQPNSKTEDSPGGPTRHYSYSYSQLVNYEHRRKRPTEQESCNTYRIGGFSLEIVEPFSLNRILFNGVLQLDYQDATDVTNNQQHVSARISISTHPTCDKFDYRNRFNRKHLSQCIQNCLDDSPTSGRWTVSKLIELIREDRLDSPMMFQLEMDLHQQEQSNWRSIFWGAKLKRWLERPEMSSTDRVEGRENLFVWSRAGHQIHLTRPVGMPYLVHGLVANMYEYPSHLYVAEAALPEGYDDFAPLGQQVTNFEDDLSRGTRIKLRAFKRKDYLMEIVGEPTHPGGKNDNFRSTSKPFPVCINGFDGWAMVHRYDDLACFRNAQRAIEVLSIHNKGVTSALACERLLGGKGNSLVQLAALVGNGSGCEAGLPRGTRVSVPRGVVLSAAAYEHWLTANWSTIGPQLVKLDCIRKSLAARSIHLNPMSDQRLPLAQSKSILRDECDKTQLVLRSCPLPPLLVVWLSESLNELFGPFKQQSTGDQPQSNVVRFAIRSSAVGEDSLETSAAGQMKTILGACTLAEIQMGVIACWASQFGLEPVSYKLQNGLSLNLPMAVVIQELIDCRVAGVAASCDPLTGNVQKLEITANEGLGEGVVAGQKTDTIRVTMEEIQWKPEVDDSVGWMKSGVIEIFDADGSGSCKCCLEKGEIIALSNLVLHLRRSSSPKEREIEWGVTGSLAGSGSSSSSSSSSSCSSSKQEVVPTEGLHLHLLQSRPLTNLQRLTGNEIDHELDWGQGTPDDLVTRANLGEVMPGAMSPLFITFFSPIVHSDKEEKPFERHHTRQVYAATTFGFFRRMATLVLTHNDAVSKFPPEGTNQRASTAIRLMIGTSLPSGESSPESIILLARERLSPLTSIRRDGLSRVISRDLGLSAVKDRLFIGPKGADYLLRNLTPIDQLIAQLEEASQRPPSLSDRFYSDKSPISGQVRSQLAILFDRISKPQTALRRAWRSHIHMTSASMAYNVMCLSFLANQEAYKSQLGGLEVSSPEQTEAQAELLNDFSLLMRDGSGGSSIESADISLLLDKLLDCIISESRLSDLSGLESDKQLYRFLTSGLDSPKCAQLYRQFMDRNGHRAFKEFDLGSLTWSDDPSHIVAALRSRLRRAAAKANQKEAGELGDQRKSANNTDQDSQRVEGVWAKVGTGKMLLRRLLIPRARQMVARREQSKSHLVKTIGQYRSAFRHLGGLLCLEGRLPDAQLIFQLTINEISQLLASFVASDTLLEASSGCTYNSGSIPRMLFKARRRQQRTKLLDQMTFPEPTIRFHQMIRVLQEFDSEKANRKPTVNSDKSGSISGLTSCSGCVTGRACVVNSLAEIEQLKEGDILITYSIDISWSVYFFAISGIVTEVGGIVSHGAVIAREYGIPTLCTAVGACSTFSTGQMITLDATRGCVFPAVLEGVGEQTMAASDVERATPVVGDAS